MDPRTKTAFFRWIFMHSCTEHTVNKPTIHFQFAQSIQVPQETEKNSRKSFIEEKKPSLD